MGPQLKSNPPVEAQLCPRRNMYGITSVTTIVPYGMWHPSWVLSFDGETVKIVEWLVCNYSGGWENHKLLKEDLEQFMHKFSRGEACTLNMALLCQAHPECAKDRFRCLGIRS